MREIIQDDFHKQMRERMSHNYYFQGGRERAQIRKYLSRYQLDKNFLLDCTTMEDKISKLKQYASSVKQQQKMLH